MRSVPISIDSSTFGSLPQSAHTPSERYRPPFGRPRSALVQRDIAALDAKRDSQKIVQLLALYEFPFDIARALEVALFHTYGSRSVSRLLNRTGEFEKRGQKRYDDTRLLIAHFMETGYEVGEGARAIAQMNHIHGFYGIPNEDFLFVLWTFIDFPIQWLREFGWRAFTPHEEEAWFNFWAEIGRRMKLRDVPESKAAFDAFVRDYESREFVPNEASKAVADATIRILENWFPTPLRPAVAPIVLCLVPPHLLAPIGRKAPPAELQQLVRGILKTRAVVKRFVSIEQLPAGLQGTLNRTYPGNSYAIESLGPEHARRKAYSNNDLS